VSKKTCTERPRDADSDAAFDAQADHLVLTLDEKRWNEFVAALAAPPRENARLRKLLARKPAWAR
jgi:uncharacterized protein (DUF1778 family)